nr:hypothetical protein [Tanacetum cinerariifolium]
YDVLRLTPFYKAFLVTTDVPEIYMEMLHICPRFPNQTFDELLFEEEILAFLRYLEHSGEIRKITDVNIDKLHQPWRSFAAVINKCRSEKASLETSNTQHFNAILPIELTNEDIKNSAAYKEYYAVASGAAPPKTKASVRKTQSSSDTTITPPIVAGTRLSTLAKGKQPAKSSKAKGTDEGTSIIPGIPDVPTDEFDKEISWKSSDEDIHEEEAKDKESFDPIVQTPENSDDDGNDDANLGMNVGDKEGQVAEDNNEELYRDANINLEGQDVQMIDVHTTKEFEDTHVTLTPVNPDGQQQSSSVDVQASTTVAPLTLTAPTLPPLTIPTISQFAGAVSSIRGIVKRYMDQQMNEAVTVMVQMQSDRFRDKAQAENEEFLNKLDDNIQNIIKEQVKEQVKTSYAMAADLSEMELKKIPIEKTKSNKSIHQSDEQRILYKALMKNPSLDKAGGPRRRKRARVNKRSKGKGAVDDQPIAEASQHLEWFQIQKKPPTPDRAWNKTLPATHRSIQPWISDLAKQADSRSSFNKLMDTPVDFSAFLRIDSKFAVNRESARDVYSKRRIIAITELQIVEWHDYKHLDWITVRKDDDKLYKFKEGDLKRLRIQDIKDMLLLLVQGKLTNLTIEERFALNVSLRMFTRSIVIQRRVEDLQLRVESYQKKIKLTKPDTYRTDLKRKEAYTAYSNPRGFIYQNKDKQNRYSNPMIQPEPEGSTQGYPLVSVEVLRYDKKSKSENIGIVPTKMELILEQTQEGISHEVSVNPHGFAGHLKMEVKELNHSNFFNEIDYEIPDTPCDEEKVANSPKSEGSNSFWYGSSTLDQNKNEGMHSLGSNGSATGNEMAATLEYNINISDGVNENV